MSRDSIYNKAPNNAKFFKHVVELYDDHINNPEKTHLLNSFYQISCPDVDIPEDSFWFHSERGLTDIQTLMSMSPNEYGDPEVMDNVAVYIEEINLRQDVEELITDPEGFHFRKDELTFDMVAEQMTRTHVVRPITFKEDDWRFPANASLLHW